MVKDAQFSECGKFRYVLTRGWDESKPVAMCIGLNPSNANAIKEDPTIRILIKTLTALGFGALKMCNLYGLISSKPGYLFQNSDNQGQNQEWLETTAYGVQEIIFCWGSFSGIDYRAKRVCEMFPDGKCFGRSKHGAPLHPMALMYGGIKPEDVQLLRYR